MAMQKCNVIVYFGNVLYRGQYEVLQGGAPENVLSMHLLQGRSPLEQKYPSFKS